jgi:hypothetical protein
MTTSVLTSSGGKGTLRVVGDSDVDLERVRVAIAAFSASRARRCSRARSRSSTAIARSFGHYWKTHLDLKKVVTHQT